MITRGRAVTVAVSLLLTALAAVPARAEDKVTVTGPEKTTQVELDKNESTGAMAGSLRFVVGTSADLATPLNVTVALDITGDASDTVCTRQDAAKAVLRGAPTPLTVESPAAVIVDLTVDRKCADRQGTLVVAAEDTGPDSSITPATLRFALIRGVEQDPEYENALGGASVLALLALVLMIVPRRWLWADVRPGWRSKPLPIDVPWTAKDSWVTNITALGALLGTLLAASGVLQEWLPGISLARFLTMNLLFGGLVLVAPVVYSASCTYTLQTDSDGGRKLKATGHGWGIVASAFVTVFGVFGQLSMVLAMTVAANAKESTKWLVGAGLCLGAAAVGLYAVLFVRGTLAAAAASGSGNQADKDEPPAGGGPAAPPSAPQPSPPQTSPPQPSPPQPSPPTPAAL
ncbi:hypothetical protein J3A78_000760 [Streptomyces sp. PvR006]|uniref:hypothetical protein n=1 Tax=unclassified Streptomyces TaxID=2593676 RepID=UPI001AEA98DA|nr:hypothetical protein [Streptomyces sp. PvR006]MBP2580282.1 hypothetical protein [Streptomyces sp. PvR006]